MVSCVFEQNSMLIIRTRVFALYLPLISVFPLETVHLLYRYNSYFVVFKD